MESSEKRSELFKAFAASRSPAKEGVGPSTAGNIQPQASDSPQDSYSIAIRHNTNSGEQNSSSLSFQKSDNRSPRTRKSRPGAHFQAPQASSRAPLAQCNILFLPSNLQAPQGSRERLENVNAPPALRSKLPESDALIEPAPPQQSFSGVTASPSPTSSPLRNVESVKHLVQNTHATMTPHDNHVGHSAGEYCQSSASRLALPNAQAGVSLGSRSLLPAALYLKALGRINAATSRKHIPSISRTADMSMEGAPPLKIFCGTWNCQYQVFPLNVLTNKTTAKRLLGAVDGSGAPASSERSLSPSRQTAECLPEEVPAEVIAKLDGDFEDLYDSEEGGSHSDSQTDTSRVKTQRFIRRGTIKRGDLVRSSTKLLKAVEGDDQPLGDWLLPGYDIYVVSLQETLGHSFFDTVTVYLTTANGIPFKRIKFPEDKLSGLGDGAWMQFKSTSLAVWAREDLEGEGMPVSLVGSKATSVSILSGSKGGVSVCLKIWNQFFCFIGCHMPSSSPEDRRKARAVIEQRLLESYGGATNWQEAFHHVVWMGDFNFRTQRVTNQRAVSLLKQSPTGLLSFDEWIGPHGEDMRTAGFVEAPISFPPTYKKADGRPPANMTHPKWVEDEYQTRMVTQWYKGSRHQDRIPSWTDRIFKCSIAEVSSLVRFQPDLYFAAMPNRPSFLVASDHSPVGLGIECFPLDAAYVLPSVTSGSLSNKASIMSGDSRTMRMNNSNVFLSS